MRQTNTPWNRSIHAPQVDTTDAFLTKQRKTTAKQRENAKAWNKGFVIGDNPGQAKQSAAQEEPEEVLNDSLAAGEIRRALADKLEEKALRNERKEVWE